MSWKFRSSMVVALGIAATLLVGCERPPIQAVQRGFRGTAMDEIYNPRAVAAQSELNAVPEPLAAANGDGPKAGTIYQNVKVLGDLSIGEFTRTMLAMTAWVAPKEGCAYCHNAANFAEDSKYTKVVARRMVQMTQHLNVDWKTHVAQTGVTCYTCHRGNPVPANVWFEAAPQRQEAGLLGNKAGQNTPALAAAMASLPGDPFTPYLLQAQDIRVNGTQALPGENRHSIKQGEWTYSLMMHMSKSLGVNCTYCHNTRAFSSWETSTPQRVTAWYGIRMARDLNVDYLTPLTGTFPAHRLGPTGDVAKVNCATCHQGAFKPLYGASMLKDYPAFGAIQATVIAPPAADASAPSGAVVDSAVLYFGVNASTLPDDGAKGLEGVIAALKANPDAKVSISGYHSAAGSLAANQQLAKARAFAVRDALQGAGIAADRVVLEKPVQAEANLSGEDPKARRVEVSLK